MNLEITKHLAEYQVEYNVLQEEISTANHHLEALNKERIHNQHLETELQVSHGIMKLLILLLITSIYYSLLSLV